MSDAEQGELFEPTPPLPSGDVPGDLSDRAALIALSGLPLMGPARLGAVLAQLGPAEALRRLQAGRLLPIEVSSSVQQGWRSAAQQVDAHRLSDEHDRAGVSVASRQCRRYPPRLVDDPEPPAVLFWTGSLKAVKPDVACVGIVGTRRCTRYGRDVAFELGCVLGAAGVTVVSGLALGIDAAAHAGVLHAGGVPVGVVASGVDTVYPRANAGLWSEVAESGAVMSEHPLGVRGQRWMFPARNRIIAGLCDVLVVVETGPTGGSFYTVDAALQRDRPVFAVPGPVRSVASQGTNRLLADGASPMCSPEDVLEALGLAGIGGNAVDESGQGAASSIPSSPGGSETTGDPRDDAILAAFGWQPRTIEQLVDVADLSAGVVATRLQLLVAQGLVVQQAGRFDRTIRKEMSRQLVGEFPCVRAHFVSVAADRCAYVLSESSPQEHAVQTPNGGQSSCPQARPKTAAPSRQYEAIVAACPVTRQRVRRKKFIKKFPLAGNQRVTGHRHRNMSPSIPMNIFTGSFIALSALLSVGVLGLFAGRSSLRERRSWHRVTVLMAVVALVGASCGSDRSSETDAATGAVDSVADAAADAADAAESVDDDAERSLSVEELSRDAVDDAMEEEVSSSTSLNSRVENAAGGLYEADDTDASVDDGDAEGLFDDSPRVPEPDDAEDRLRDNRFVDYGYRQFIDTDRDALSTFSLDVDTGSFTVARRWLAEGVQPPPEAVRVEEFVNAFDYDYDVPRRGLEITVEGGPSPFDEDNYLVAVGVQAEIVEDGDRPPVALTFVVDTSGSMDRDDRLGLVKDSLEILVDQLEDDDTVAIVVYSNGAGTLLEPTRVANDRDIYDAIDSLSPGGSTNLESGLREGYDLARSAFREDGINRVIIASDGVANAGITDVNDLGRIIRDDADNGIQLVTVGYGMGNFNDVTMEQLADNGDGFYAYVDTLDEAERLFEDELTSTLVTAAIDAKIQVEFDPDVVREYRLIGYENRGVRDSDFRNDAVDAGELGAGHQATALYEIELHRQSSIEDRGNVGEVFLRWEDPETGDVQEIDEDIDLRDIRDSFRDTSTSFQLATVVGSFAEVLRDNPYADDVNLRNVLVEAERVADVADTDEVDELVDMIRRANEL